MQMMNNNLFLELFELFGFGTGRHVDDAVEVGEFLAANGHLFGEFFFGGVLFQADSVAEPSQNVLVGVGLAQLGQFLLQADAFRFDQLEVTLLLLLLRFQFATLFLLPAQLPSHQQQLLAVRYVLHLRKIAGSFRRPDALEIRPTLR